MKQKSIKVMKKGGFLSNAGNAALNLGKAYADYNLSALGLGEVIPDTAYKGNTGQFFGKASNIAGQVGQAILPAAANVLLPGSGAAVSAGQNLLSGSKANKSLSTYADKTIEPPKLTTESQSNDLPSYMQDNSLGSSYRAYGKGGEVDGENGMVMVNVEGGELEITPDTFEVVQDFKNLPKHPKGKDIVNMKGNVHMNKNNIIIPANKRDAFLKAKGKDRAMIVNEVIVSARNSSKKQEGGLAPMEEPLNTNLAISPELQNNVNQAYYNQGKTAGQQNNDFISTGAVGAAAAVPGLIYGMKQAKESKKSLSELSKTPLPKYGVTPEQIAAQNRAGRSYSRAEGLAKQGYTDAERAAFGQNLAKSNATTLYNARNQAGGQMSGAINAALNSQSLNALLNFASNDASLNRQNIRYADQAGQYLDQTGQQITQQKNLQTNVDIQRRLMQEQALGKALSEGRVNTTNSLSQLAGNAALIGSQFL